MGPFGRKREGIRLIALIFLLEIVAQCSVLCDVTEETGLLLDEETTAASSITENTDGKNQFSSRTTGSITNESRYVENLSTPQVTTYKPLVEAQGGTTGEDSPLVSSKTDKEAVNSTTSLSHEVETTTLSNETAPSSNAAYMTTPLSPTNSSLPAPARDITDARHDASGTSTPANSTSAISNTTPTAMSSGRSLLGANNKGVMSATTSDSHRIQKETATTMKSQMPAAKTSETPTVLPGSGMASVTTERHRATVSDHTTDADNSSSSVTMAATTSPSSYSSPLGPYKWYIIAAVIVLALLILIICFVWNVRRRRNTGSTSFQNPAKKKTKKAGEEAWAGPVQMTEENCVPMEVVGDGQDPSGKRLTLTTFFNKRKTRQCSVVLEEVAAQPGKSRKDEMSSPLLTPNSNTQANGSANDSQSTQSLSPTSKERRPTSGEREPPPPTEVDSQSLAVQGPPPAQSADGEVLPPPPPTPPPETGFPAPPPSP